MRGGGGVAHQHDVAVATSVSQSTRGKLIQAEPRMWRALEIRRVAAELVREQPLAGGDRLLLRHLRATIPSHNRRVNLRAAELVREDRARRWRSNSSWLISPKP